MAKSTEIAQAFAALGFESIGAACVGGWRGYAVSLTTADNGGYFLRFAVRIDKKNNEPLLAVGAALKAAGRRASVSNNGAAIVLNLRFDGKSPAEQQAREFLELTTSALYGCGVGPADTCALCGGGAPESLCWLDSWQPVHAGCVHQRTVQARESAEHNRLNGSYLTGLLGAVLGALVGLIPNLLTILFLERIIAVLFALVPLAAMWGYRKLGGKMDGFSIVIVIVLSVLSVPLMTTVVASYQLAQEAAVSFGEAFSYVAGYVTTGEGFKALLSDSLMEFVFMALGLFIARRALNQTGANGVKLAEAAEATMRTNPAYMPPAGAAPGSIPKTETERVDT